VIMHQTILLCYATSKASSMLRIFGKDVRHGATGHFIFGKWPTIVSRRDCSIHVSRCLAHVINLATQALLAAHSPAKHYDPTKPTEHEPDVDRYLRDEIALVRAIVVKVSTVCQTFFIFDCQFSL
jgi:hypothetical protein